MNYKGFNIQKLNKKFIVYYGEKDYENIILNSIQKCKEYINFYIQKEKENKEYNTKKQKEKEIKEKEYNLKHKELIAFTNNITNKMLAKRIFNVLTNPNKLIKTNNGLILNKKNYIEYLNNNGFKAIKNEFGYIAQKEKNSFFELSKYQYMYLEYLNNKKGDLNV